MTTKQNRSEKMYQLKVRSAVLFTGTKSDCLDYMLRYKLHRCVIEYVMPEKSSNNWFKSACKELGVYAVMFAAVAGYFACLGV